MENRSKLMYIGEGVLRGFFLTLALILVLVVISSFFQVSASIRSVCFIVLSTLSVVYGSIYSTKKIREKGWIIGIIVAILYIVILYFVAIFSGDRGFLLSSKDFFRLFLAVAVGSLSGMLGINL